MFARCNGEASHASTILSLTIKSLARFCPAYVYAYPAFLNQYHGVLPSGLWCAKYPLVTKSCALSCAARASKEFSESGAKPWVLRTSLVSTTNAERVTSAKKYVRGRTAIIERTPSLSTTATTT